MGRRGREIAGGAAGRVRAWRVRAWRVRAWRVRALGLVAAGVVVTGAPAGAAAVLAPGSAVAHTAPVVAPAASTPARAAVPGSAPRWAWPLAPPQVVGAYAAPPTPYAAGHRGIDLAATPEPHVTAPADATVRFAGVVVDRPVLTLDHGGGVLSSYEPLATDLIAGQSVARGSVIGLLASGGHCADSCLHVGVRVDGAYVSPLLFFDRVPPSVLLPLGRDG
ncbi:murein hydrolase activator EnvC family protein [Leifsonia aquatica]|uniref:murein hydrolase activator EnvC family protein n=1 Tax=Leifsonia aquatica TaxID=144185 RepID=UPI003830CFDD